MSQRCSSNAQRATAGHRRPRHPLCLLILFAVAALTLAACAGAMPMETEAPAEEPAEEPAPEEPAGAEPTTAPSTPTPLPTAAATAPPTETRVPGEVGEPAPSPTPIVVQAAPDAPAGETLGRLDVEYPVRMAPEASDTVILELSIPELLAAAEPVAVARVEEAEPVSEDLGRYDAVVYLAPRMAARLTAPAITIDPLTPVEQDLDLESVDVPTTWAWTVQAPDSAGKQVMTLQLFRAGDDAPLWTGSLRVDVVAARQLESNIGEESNGEAVAPVTADPVPTEQVPGIVPAIVQALTQDVTGLVLGILSLIGSIVAAVLAAWVERGGSLKRPRQKTRGFTPSPRPGGALRALWFRISERFRSRRK